MDGAEGSCFIRVSGLINEEAAKRCILYSLVQLDCYISELYRTRIGHLTTIYW